jgi:bifunctional aspartokinase / homoserine dehydrogenase 1
MTSERWVVHKFGGSSVASAERYRHVGRLLGGRAEPRRAVVVSAMSGVTDLLMRAVELAGGRDGEYRSLLDELKRKHRDAVSELVPLEEGKRLIERIEADLVDVGDVLHAAWLMRSASRGVRELVSGYGEVWSAQILCAHLRARGDAAAWLDAREVLVATPTESAAEVAWEPTRERLDGWLTAAAPLPSTVVVTGYVAATPEGVPTTLGRNGSDFSAAIFGALLDAAEIHIWTDVDGVMSANPRLVPDAVLLDSLSYDEAMELAYFGAKVIHPSTMAPAVSRQIPLFIRNTFNPEHPGTRIHLSGDRRFSVKGFATVEGVALVNLEGTGMIGVPGTAQRLFGALRDAGISVILISQGSSEHSICFAVPGTMGERARLAAEQAFFAERHHGQILTVELVRDCCILAVVGDGMAGQPGVSGKLFGALGRAGVNIRAIAQGSSERNISVVIDNAEASRALRAVHAGYYLSPQTLSIGVIGTGLVGSTLMAQLGEASERLKERFNLDLRVRAVATSRRMLLSDEPLQGADWRERLEAGSEAVDPQRLAAHVHAGHLPHSVLIDCTASDAVARCYADWLRGGIHLITPNKRANTAELPYYRELRSAARQGGVHLLYETTVGAGLPIIQTLRDLILTGDEVLEIEGVLSGTLSFLFNSLDGSEPFSTIVRRAREMGYTEPDPRDDLSGQDVARKVVILAREMGLETELSHVEVESLVPEAMREGSVAEFLERLSEHDDALEERRTREATAGRVLRYVGSVDREGRASAALRAYPADHPFAGIRLTDNVVQFRTRRYDQNPLIVQGPGAGPEVTAAGVFADLLRLSSYLGAAL